MTQTIAVAVTLVAVYFAVLCATAWFFDRD